MFNKSWKLDEFKYLHDVKNSVYDKVIANQAICNLLSKLIAFIYSITFFSSQDDVEQRRY